MKAAPGIEGPGAAACVVGVGVDLASVPEIRQAMNQFGERYLRRIFTPNELSCCRRTSDPAPRLAAMFAAKEALIKVLAIKDGQPPWTSIEVQQVQGGRLELHLAGAAAEMAAQRGIDGLALSLSHDGDLATATVIATRGR